MSRLLGLRHLFENESARTMQFVAKVGKQRSILLGRPRLQHRQGFSIRPGQPLGRYYPREPEICLGRNFGASGVAKGNGFPQRSERAFSLAQRKPCAGLDFQQFYRIPTLCVFQPPFNKSECDIGMGGSEVKRLKAQIRSLVSRSPKLGIEGGLNIRVPVGVPAPVVARHWQSPLLRRWAPECRRKRGSISPSILEPARPSFRSTAEPSGPNAHRTGH